MKINFSIFHGMWNKYFMISYLILVLILSYLGNTISMGADHRMNFKSRLDSDTTKKKVYDYNSAFIQEFGKPCNEWNLDIPELLDVIKKSKPISPRDFHNDFEVLPCHYELKIVNGIDTIIFKVNAGGGIRRFENGKFKEYLGCYADCGGRFIVDAWPIEEEID